jgi:hypothetical protein
MPYRTIVWGTGNVGRPALRAVLANPALELAGVIVSNPAKEGRDAGELCGRGATGVLASRDVAAVLDAGADAVAYCASGDFRPDEALDDIEKALRAGMNVVSTSVYPLYDPASAPPQLRSRMEDACRAGGSSCFVSGIDPGYVNDVLPLLLSGLCAEIEEIRAFEWFDYSYYDAEDAVRNLVGFGQPMDNMPLMISPGVPTMVWGGVLRLLARGLGVELDEIRERVERRSLPKTVTNRLGVFEAGTLGAFRFEVQGIVGGAPKLVVEHVTRIGNEVADDWPRPEGSGAHGVKITGSPNLELRIEAEDEPGDRASGGNATAAARVVNSIPAVCRAQPGLLDALSVPLQIGRGLLR